MKEATKVYLLSDNGQKFFGEGPCRLLRAVEKTGSLRSAALSMNMAYTKAVKLIKQAETAMGYPLTERVTGGKNGGGSCLTPEGKELLQKYETYRNKCIETNRRIFEEIFGDNR